MEGIQLTWLPSSLDGHSNTLSLVASTVTSLRGLGRQALDPQEGTLLSSQRFLLSQSWSQPRPAASGSQKEDDITAPETSCSLPLCPWLHCWESFAHLAFIFPPL